jgi:ABC-2 type transport system ATP-binding protein
MSSPVIEAQGLSRVFGSLRAIDGLDLVVEKGTIYGFLGPNGCGKTTAIRMLTGSLYPSEGSVRVLGHELPKAAEALRLKTGYMTQKFSLYDNLTIKENLLFTARIFGLSHRQRKERVVELLHIYGLNQKADQLAGSLSGGQRQRLALAAAVLHKPELLFLDEPTSAVDPENRREFWEQLFDLCDSGTSILVSTHYMDEAERCHKIAILEAGKKRADGAPEDLMHDMNTHVVEIEGPELRQLKKQLVAQVEVKSAAQLGTRLRVLVNKSVIEPIHWLQQLLGDTDSYHIEIVRPSLEDVFVTCTGEGRQ